jgi:hypothetical protein
LSASPTAAEIVLLTSVQGTKKYLMRLTIYVDWEPDAGMAWPQLSMSLTPNVSMTGFTICLSFYIWTLEYRYTDRFTR